MAEVDDQSFNVADIDKTEELVKQHYERISQIESQLRRRHLTPAQEETAQQEVDDIKRTLKEHERTLKRLRSENRRIVIMVIVFVLVFGALWVLFSWIYQIGNISGSKEKDEFRDFEPLNMELV